jgi:hypothetical protein
MSLHDAYYEPPDDDSEEIQERVWDLLQSDNNQFDADNIREAIFEDAFQGHWETLSTLLHEKNHSSVGGVISGILWTYWEKRSQREVINGI